ncbi:MAG: hypothetical protein PHC66_02290 [Candidatus Nanoarchaeia archaeon]|nr:hypothetical protein [Candidatus Nanoarchaeia archaeon]MDD5239517.1 hypothetical protein [Candidatus Nanoarchaeia archaeon]
MAKFKEAMNRLFTNMFVCRNCKSKLRADPLKVRLGEIKCRKCQSKQLRPKHKEVKGTGTAAPGAAPAPGGAAKGAPAAKGAAPAAGAKAAPAAKPAKK